MKNTIHTYRFTTQYFLFTQIEFRATECVCFSILFYLHAVKVKSSSYSLSESLVFFVFLFFLSMQHRPSLLVMFFLLTYMLFVKFSIKDITLFIIAFLYHL